MAPAFTSRGADANGTTAETNVSAGPTVTVPTAGYPTLILFSPDRKEITRLPGEVDAAQVMQLLQ